jgi:hypothetical protein
VSGQLVAPSMCTDGPTSGSERQQKTRLVGGLNCHRYRVGRVAKLAAPLSGFGQLACCDQPWGDADVHHRSTPRVELIALLPILRAFAIALLILDVLLVFSIRVKEVSEWPEKIIRTFVWLASGTVLFALVVIVLL